MGVPEPSMSRMRARKEDEVAIYESLVRIQRGFTQVLDTLETLRQNKSYRGPSINAAVRAVRETRAGTLFEVLEVVHAREEREWSRRGRRRTREAAR
jgi:hypothetical protein